MVPRSAWLYVCPSCHFFRSTLKPGKGADVEGLEDLRRQNFGTLLDRVSDLASPHGKRLLEVGCSQGWFLDAAADRGFEVAGVEPNIVHAKRARKRGHSVEVGFFPEVPAKRQVFDLIVFNDVFEHIPNPGRTVASCAELLAKDGLLVINIPNSNGILYRVATSLARLGIASPLERLWQKGLSSPHLLYFNPENLDLLVMRDRQFARCYQGVLPSVSSKGLWQRLRSASSLPVSLTAWLAIRGSGPILRFLPADIMLAVYRRL